MTGAAAGGPFRWRSVILVAVLPTALFATGQGAIIPVLPAIAGDLGATLAIAGLVGATLMVGELIGDIPSGLLVAKIGERNAMLGILGIATSVFALARHAMLTTYVPATRRARAMSTLGGPFRFGWSGRGC